MQEPLCHDETSCTAPPYRSIQPCALQAAPGLRQCYRFSLPAPSPGQRGTSVCIRSWNSATSHPRLPGFPCYSAIRCTAKKTYWGSRLPAFETRSDAWRSRFDGRMMTSVRPEVCGLGRGVHASHTPVHGGHGARNCRPHALGIRCVILASRTEIRTRQGRSRWEPTLFCLARGRREGGLTEASPTGVRNHRVPGRNCAHSLQFRTPSCPFFLSFVFEARIPP